MTPAEQIAGVIESALKRGWEFEPSEFAKYLRIEMRPIAETTRNHLAELLDRQRYHALANHLRHHKGRLQPWLRDHLVELFDTYPKRGRKHGPHKKLKHLTFDTVKRLVNIRGNYHWLRYDLAKAYKRIKRIKKDGAKPNLAALAKEFNLREKDLDLMSFSKYNVTKKDLTPANAAFAVLQHEYKLAGRFIRDLVTDENKRPGIPRKLLRPFWRNSVGTNQ